MPTNSSVCDFSSLPEALRNGCDWRSVTTILRRCVVAIEQDPEDFYAIWHPLGFASFWLWEKGQESVRLNLWSDLPGEYTGLGWHIHKHNWDLASYVLCGYLESRTYRILQNTSNHPTHRVYNIQHDGDMNYLRASPRVVSCELDRVEIVQPGNRYRLAQGVFHSAHAAEGCVTATLVLASEVQGTDAAVLGPLQGVAEYQTERRRCPHWFVREAVALVVKILGYEPEDTSFPAEHGKRDTMTV